MPAEVAVYAIPHELTPRLGEGALGYGGCKPIPPQDPEPDLWWATIGLRRD